MIVTIEYVDCNIHNLERMQTLFKDIKDSLNGIVIVVDRTYMETINAIETFQLMEKVYSIALQRAGLDVKKLLIINKSDQEATGDVDLAMNEMKKYGVIMEAAVYLCSAKTGRNVDSAFKHLVNEIHYKELGGGNIYELLVNKNPALGLIKDNPNKEDECMATPFYSTHRF